MRRTGAQRTRQHRAIAAACGMRVPAPRRTAARLMVPTRACSIVGRVGTAPRARAGDLVHGPPEPGLQGPAERARAHRSVSKSSSSPWPSTSSERVTDGIRRCQEAGAMRRATGRCSGASRARVRGGCTTLPAPATGTGAPSGLREAGGTDRVRLDRRRPGRRTARSLQSCRAGGAAGAVAAVAPTAAVAAGSVVAVVTHVLLAVPAGGRGALEGVGAADLLLADVGATGVGGRAARDAEGVGRSGDQAGRGPGAAGDGGAADQDLASVHPELRTLSAGSAASSVAVEPVVTHLLMNPQ